MSLPWSPDVAVSRLAGHLRAGPFAVITGAGLSTGSGIPAYRDRHGRWQHPRPLLHQDFLRSEAVRRRYWARSYVGWQRMGRARPNAGHAALAMLADRGHLASSLITQNVDGLHQKAGSEAVIELHGNIGRVRCMACQSCFEREAVQGWLEALNGEVAGFEGLARGEEAAATAPDGDAHLDDAEVLARFRVPDCPACRGLLKPDVVFFGDNVPRERVARAMGAVSTAAGLLVVGSSLMVYSGYRFAEHAHTLGKPVIALNRGLTSADGILADKIEMDCGEALVQLLQALP